MLPKDAEILVPCGGARVLQNTKAVRDIVKSQTGISIGTNHDLRRTYKSIGTELDINSVLVR